MPRYYFLDTKKMFSKYPVYLIGNHVGKFTFNFKDRRSTMFQTKITEMLGPLNDDSLIPVTVNPDQLLIVIAGGDGKQSHYFSPLPASFPVSKPVRK